MTNNHKKILLSFITRTGMYIMAQDQNNIVSFVNGYEIGTEGECEFSQLLSKYFEENLSVKHSSDGWPGQVKRYSDNKFITWTNAFKQIGLEVISSNGGLDGEMQEIFKTRIKGLIERVRDDGDPWFDKSWVDEWNSLCVIESLWFQNIWTSSEYKIITSLDKEIKRNKVFKDWKPFRPTSALLELSNSFKKLNK